MPVKGRYYAMNEGNINECNPKIIDYIKYCQSRENDYGNLFVIYWIISRRFS